MVTSLKRMLVFISTVFLLGTSIGYTVGYFRSKTPENDQGKINTEERLSVEIVLGAISTYSDDAEYMNQAMEIALEEVNEYVVKLGLNITFSIRFEDADLSDTIALDKFKSLAESGVKIVLGMWWSSQLEAVLSYANENHIVVISSASTAPSLAVPDDYVFRLVPTDIAQGRALARMIRDKGIEAVVVLQQDNIWGEGLGAEFVRRFEELGGSVLDRIKYSPYREPLPSQLRTAADKVKSALEEYGESKVAVEAISMGEIEVLLPQAEDYPPLTEVPWFGSDGYVRWVALAEELSAISLRTRHYSPLTATTKSSKWKTFVNKFSNRTGLEIRHYESESYDSVWVAALAVIQAGSYDSEAVKEILPDICDKYFGASGWLKLDENGDKAVGDYDIFAVTSESGVAAWRKVGIYRSEPDEVNWLEEPN